LLIEFFDFFEKAPTEVRPSSVRQEHFAALAIELDDGLEAFFEIGGLRREVARGEKALVEARDRQKGVDGEEDAAQGPGIGPDGGGVELVLAIGENGIEEQKDVELVV